MSFTVNAAIKTQAPCFFVVQDFLLNDFASKESSSKESSSNNLAMASEYFDKNAYVVLILQHTHGEKNFVTRDEARRRIREAVIHFASHVLRHANLLSLLSLLDQKATIHGEIGEAKCLHIGEKKYSLSFSHDNNISVVAIAKSGKIGIDIIKINKEYDWQPSAELFLSPASNQVILQTEKSQQFQQFCQEWTQLEAATKCCGIPLQEFSDGVATACRQCHLISWNLSDDVIISVARMLG